MNKLGQDSAFPFELKQQISYTEVKRTNYKGMSKRFYAACAAMQGILANEHINPNGLMPIKDKVAIAYQYADELLKQEYNE